MQDHQADTKDPARGGSQRLTADAVTQSLRAMILDGTLPVGVQLKQEALARRFGVSRIPVREALKRLEAEGLAAHTAHQGSVVASKSLQELLEILDIRAALETRALRLAMPRLRREDLARARKLIRSYDASERPGEWAELNLEFHLCLYRPCARPRLLAMIEDLVRGVDIHLRARQSHALGRKGPQAEHRAILAACAKKDGALAVELLEQHIEHTQQALRLAHAAATPA